MKLIVVIILGLLIIVVNLDAKDKWIIRAGLNYSKFRDDKDSDLKLGYTISILKEWYLIDDFSLDVGLGYSERGGILKNKIVRTFYSESGQLEPVYSYNLNCSIAYIDLPLFFRYKIKINDYNFHLNSGLYISFPISSVNNEVELSKNQFLFFYDNSNSSHREYNFEYDSSEDSGYGVWWGRIFNPNYGFNFGFGITIRSFILDFIYMHDLKEFGSDESGIYIFDKSHSFYLLFGLEI